MTGFGEKLRREREMRGVSLDEIAESTKIGTRNLRALEEEDFDKLPGGIFNKGFVRAYSHFLGLDEEQTVTDFDLALKEHQAVKGQAEIIQITEEPETVRLRQFVVVAVLAFIAIIGTTWYLVHRHLSASEERAQHAIGESARTSSRSNQIPSSAPAASTKAPQPALTPPSGSPDEKARPEAPKQDSVPASSSESSQGGATDVVTDSAAPIRLEVTAHEDSWLSVFADGKSLGQEILAAQKSRTIRAQKEVRLKLGNVAGVEVSFNGKPVNIDGEPKQVKELTFTTEGLRQ